MKKIIFKTIIIILLFSHYSFSQQQNFWTSYTTKNGLVDNNVQAIIESSDGAMWFGTSEGISHYSQDIWTSFTIQNSGLASNSILSIFQTSDDTLWFGTNEGGVSRFFNGVWTTFNTKNSKLVNDSVNTIIQSSDGALWFGTSNGISRYHRGTWKTYNTDNGLASNWVNAIFEASDGSMWFGTNKGVSHYHQNIWTTYNPENSELKTRIVVTIFQSSDGALWFGGSIPSSTGGRYYRYHKGNWTSGSFNRVVCVNAIIQAYDGAMWFGTASLYPSYGGVHRLQQGNLTSFDSEGTGLVNKNVWTLIEASDGAIWIGTEGGVSRYQPEMKFWTSFTTADGLDWNYTISIMESSDGALWFGPCSPYNNTGRGVSRYKGGQWTILSGLSLGTWDAVTAILESSEKALWFGTTFSGVRRYYNETWTIINKDSGLVSDAVTSIIQHSDGSLWFGTAGGVSRFQQESWTTYTTDNGLADNNVKIIIESSDGALWFGTMGGASRLQQGKWTTFNVDNSGLNSNSVSAIIESSDGALWFAGAGVSRYYQGNWTTFSVTDGLVSNGVSSILESSDGAMWFGTSMGVSHFHNGFWTTITSAHGLVDNNVWTIIESSDGFVWFGTGYINVNDYYNSGGGVSRLVLDKRPPLTYIKERPKSLVGTSTPLFIVSGNDNYSKKDELLFSYIVLENDGANTLDPNLYTWSPYSTKTFIQIEPLPNGSYTFFVKAIDFWGNVDQTPAKFNFTVDITQPTVTINSPTEKQHIKGKFIINGSAFDNSPIKDFDYYKIYYGGYLSDNQEPIWQDKNIFELDSTKEVRNDTLGIFDTSGLENGLYQLRLWAKDTLQHTSEDIVRVTIDNTTPMVEITFPQSGDTLRNEFDILATVFDANIYEIKLEYKMAFQNQWKTLRKDTINYEIENQPIWHWDNLTDSGSVKIMLTASDKAGNVDIDSAQFLFDNKEYAKPMAMISTPADNDYVNGWITVRGSAADANFTKYQLFLRNQTIDTLLVESDIKKENDEILATFYSRAFPDGEYKLALIAFNNKNYHKTAIRPIIIDNTPPTADIFYPSSGDTISCTVQIHGKADDENFESLTLRYARATEKDTSKFILIDTSFTDWNTMELNGVYNLYLTVEDKGGLTAIDEHTYYINNPIYDNNEGLLKKQDEASLYIPPNGYHSSVICIEKISIDKCPCDSLTFKPTDLIFEIQSSIDDSTFDKPAVLSIAYDSLDLSQYDEEKLGVCHYENKEWNLIGGTLNKDKREITTGINEIGIYGLFEKEKEIVYQVEQLKVSCQPRVFSPNGGGSDTQTSIMFELGEEMNATIKIYNTTGRLIRLLKENEQMQIGENSIPWNGRDQNGSVCVTGLYVVSVHVEDKMATQTVVVMNK